MIKATFKGSLKRNISDTSLADLAGSETNIIRKREVETIDNETGITNTFMSPSEVPEEKGMPTSEVPTELPPPALPADIIKEINREVTQKIEPEAKNNLIEERNKLVNKKFKKGLNKNEERHLTFVRWQLDRIDDAESGNTLDLFEKFVDEHERFAGEIESLLTELKEGFSKTRRKSKR
jgi:hypothetical protein